MNEIEQLKSLASILPTVFAVAAFLTNMVLARLIAVERSEIGLLKAFGYRDGDIAWHYVELVIGIGLVGIGLGWFLGYWLRLTNTRIYAELYRFPFLLYSPGATPFLMAGLASLLAALLGAMDTVRNKKKSISAGQAHDSQPHGDAVANKAKAHQISHSKK